MFKTLHYLQAHLHLIQTNLQAKLIITHLYRHKVIKNAKLIKTWITLKLLITVTLHLCFIKLFLFGQKHCMTLA